jgi:hypothetical protein
MAVFQRFYPSLAAVLGGVFLLYAFWPRRRCSVCGDVLNRVNQARHDWWLDGKSAPVCIYCDRELAQQHGGNASPRTHLQR